MNVQTWKRMHCIQLRHTHTHAQNTVKTHQGMCWRISNPNIISQVSGVVKLLRAGHYESARSGIFLFAGFAGRMLSRWFKSWTFALCSDQVDCTFGTFVRRMEWRCGQSRQNTSLCHGDGRNSCRYLIVGASVFFASWIVVIPSRQIIITRIMYANC